MPEQLVESINDTARMARTMLSLLLVAALVVVLILSFSSDENLFRDVSVDLPQVGIGISIKQSYIVAPLIFLYLHLQVLYLLSVLARKMWAFRKLGPVARQRHFDSLSAFVFIQLFRDRHVPLFPWLLLWFGVVVIPLVLLFAMDLSFVRYQSDRITIGHHIIFIVDLVFVMWSVWIVWPSPDGSGPRAVTSRVCRMIVMPVVAVFVVPLVLYEFVDITSKYRVIPDLIFFVGALISLVGALIFVVLNLMFVVMARLGCVGCDRSREIGVVNGMIVLTGVASFFMIFFLFHSVEPPHFNTETVEKDRECIWGWRDNGKKNDDATEEQDGESVQQLVGHPRVASYGVNRAAVEPVVGMDDVPGEDASCSNYIDRFLCKSLDICRYLDLRYEWLTSTRTTDLTGLVAGEFGDENADDGHRSVNDLHVVDRSFRFAVFRHAALHGADFRKAKLEGADFTFAMLHSAKFPEAQLHNTKFRRSESKNAIFSKSKSQSADFSYSALQGASFDHAQLQGSDFKDAKLTGAFFVGAGLQGVNFEDARLQATDFTNAKSQGANFENAKLNGAVLYKAKLQGANFSRAQLEGADLARSQLQGSFYRNKENPGSWKLAWMPDVSFTSCCGGQYNEMIQEMEEKSIVKLEWRKNKEERLFIWKEMTKGAGQCVENEEKGDAQNMSLEDHLCDYLMPNTERTKLNCGFLSENGSLEERAICYENSAKPSPYVDKNKWNAWMKKLSRWRNKLAARLSKLACKDRDAAERIFSRLTRDKNVLSEDGLSHEKWKEARHILDCKRGNGGKGSRTCPGLNTIQDGKWSRLWTNFDDDVPESSCTKPNYLPAF